MKKFSFNKRIFTIILLIFSLLLLINVSFWLYYYWTPEYTEEDQFLEIINNQSEKSYKNLQEAISDNKLTEINLAKGLLGNSSLNYSLLVKLSKMNSLRKIYFGGNGIEILPYPITSCFPLQLEELYLNSNDLESISDDISKLSNLKVLDLSSNHLLRLPPTIADLQQLEILNLGIDLYKIGFAPYTKRNHLLELPSEIGNLKKLRILNLSSNLLRSIPKELTQLRQLEKLNLNWNQLKNLPADIGDLTSLKELKIVGNQLTKIPQSIIKLKKLKLLELGNNQINEQEITRLKKKLPNCKITN